MTTPASDREPLDSDPEPVPEARDGIRPSGAPELPEVLRLRASDDQTERERNRASGKPWLTIPKGKSPETKALVLAIDFVVTLGVGAVGGWLVDRWLGTQPRGTLIGAVAGVVVAVYFFAKGARQLNRDLERQTPNRRP